MWWIIPKRPWHQKKMGVDEWGSARRFPGRTSEFFDSEERHIPVRLVLNTTRNEMFIPSESSFKEQLRAFAHMSLITESGEAIREENLMGNCLKQIKMDKALNTVMKSRFWITLSTRQSLQGTHSLTWLGTAWFQLEWCKWTSYPFLRKPSTRIWRVSPMKNV